MVMLVRIVLVLGLGLILFSGGAMGWQYWKQIQAAEAGDEPGPGALSAAAPSPAAGVAAQGWLISPGGGLVDRPMVKAVLRQDGFQQSRVAHLTIRAPLEALLAPGEQLPAPPYRQVFADIRAPVLARDLCQPLLDAWASACALHSATARTDSYDAQTGTAVFHITLAYAQKTDGLPLPDLASHALYSDHAGSDLAADTVATLWSALISAAGDDCAAHEAAGLPCRITGLDLSWSAPDDARATWQPAWFAPLPKGMYPAPPLY